MGEEGEREKKILLSNTYRPPPSPAAAAVSNGLCLWIRFSISFSEKVSLGALP